MGFRVSDSAPAGNTGYSRVGDWPTAGGGPGATTNNSKPAGGFMSGLSSTISPGTSQWHPTVAWMLGFVLVELIAFHLLSRFMNI